MDKIGRISQIFGSVVDVDFKIGELPGIFNELRVMHNDMEILSLEVALHILERSYLTKIGVL